MGFLATLISLLTLIVFVAWIVGSPPRFPKALNMYLSEKKDVRECAEYFYFGKVKDNRKSKIIENLMVNLIIFVILSGIFILVFGVLGEGEKKKLYYEPPKIPASRSTN